MTQSPRTLLALLLSAFFTVGCGLPIVQSKPLTFVAPLEGVWTDTADSDVELRVSITSAGYPFNSQFSFTADIVDTGSGATTSYVGSADEETFELRDPTTNALLLSGSMTELDLTLLLLDDLRVFTKPFEPDFLSGTWQDVNVADRKYHLDADNGSGLAQGCAVVPTSITDDVGGALRVEYDGDTIDLFRVEEPSGVIRLSAPGFFVGASAIRIKRVNGFVHLQRVNSNVVCPP